MGIDFNSLSLFPTYNFVQLMERRAAADSQNEKSLWLLDAQERWQAQEVPDCALKDFIWVPLTVKCAIGIKPDRATGCPYLVRAPITGLFCYDRQGSSLMCSRSVLVVSCIDCEGCSKAFASCLPSSTPH